MLITKYADEMRIKHSSNPHFVCNALTDSSPEKLVDDLKLRTSRPVKPYSDARLLNVLQHTLCFLPTLPSATP